MTNQKPREAQAEGQAQAQKTSAEDSSVRASGQLPGYVWSAAHDAPTQELFPGIRLRPLWSGGNGAKAQLLEMDPHTCWEGIDVHEPGPEEVFVVSGVFNDGQRDYPAGTFIHAPAGSSHIPQTTSGCTLFVFYPEG
ncbi:cupin domain-containing protein [Streptomyces sp. Root1295]|uniref:cupin domain-containing protein n=1 Tax=Streptomyces sp. Root1295 TaxID=1736448 RepID=UPI000AB294E7|nr:cupin domain-containing protein [Streptomyces sp. Root1295]